MTFSFIDVKVPGGTSQNNEPQMLNEGLKGDQHKLDHDNDGDIDGKDFAMLRMKKKKKKMDSPTKDEPEGENGDTASINPKIGDKTKKEYSMSMKPSKKKLYMSKEEVDVDDILSLDEASFDNYIDDMTIEELKELEEGIIGGTVKMIGKGIGALAKGAMGAGKLAAKGASAAANRMSASGRADAAERKLAKVRNKAVDIQRRIRAKKAAKVIARGGYSKYDPAKFQQKRVNYQMAHTEYEGEVMKESPIRTALKSVVENRGEHYRSATPPETMDDKLKGGGAKKMKADLMKGAKMNDTVAKAPEDAKAAGSRGPSAKPRSSGDNIRKGDTKIIQGGTPMKDPSSPKQRLESIMNAYASMQEKTHMITVDGYTTQGEPNAHKKFNLTKKVHKGPDGKRIHHQYGGYKVSFHGSKENLAKYNDHNLGGDQKIVKKDGVKSEAAVNELSMKTLQRYRDVAAGDIQVKKGQAAAGRANAEPGRDRILPSGVSTDDLDKKVAKRQAQRQIAKGKMMIKKAKPSPTRYSSDGGSIERMGSDATKSSITKKRNESFSGTGVGTLGNIMDAYQSMNQQKSLNEEMHHIMNHVKNHEDMRSRAPGGIKYSYEKHGEMVKKLRSHHISVSIKHRECADKLATDPHHGPGHPLHMAHHEAADAHAKANEAHAHIMNHTNHGRAVTSSDDENFHNAMSASHEAAGKSSETFHIAKETR